MIGRNGETLGQIKSFMVDKYTGRVAYAIMTFGGTMGLGTSYFPLPWQTLDYDTRRGGYRIDMTDNGEPTAEDGEPLTPPEGQYR